MFDQLVETESEKAGQRSRRSYFLSSSIIVGLLFITAVVLSIYADNYGLGGMDLELTELSAPVETAVAAREKVKPRIRDQGPTSQDKKSIRTADVIETMAAATKIPKGLSISPNTYSVAPKGSFDIGAINRDASGSVGSGRDGTASGPNALSQNSLKDDLVDEDRTADAVPPPPLVRQPKTIVSKGVINSTAKSLPTPAYPAFAKTAGAWGRVSVQVTLDETGKVVSANALDGNPMLRASAVEAARRARFTPTYLSDVAVRVTGVIVYNFKR